MPQLVMSQDALQSRWRLTLEQFQAWSNERPDVKKWELVESVPKMMAPSTLMHQQISRSFEGLLDQHLSRGRPSLQANREVGIVVPDDPTCNPYRHTPLAISQ